MIKLFKTKITIKHSNLKLQSLDVLFKDWENGDDNGEMRIIEKFNQESARYEFLYDGRYVSTELLLHHENEKLEVDIISRFKIFSMPGIFLLMTLMFAISGMFILVKFSIIGVIVGLLIGYWAHSDDSVVLEKRIRLMINSPEKDWSRKIIVP